MRLAYIILAHKLPDLLVRLVHRLQSKNATFYIHVDKKTPSIVFDQMRRGLQNFESVHFLDRIESHYCYYGCVEATLRGIREALSQGTPSDFVILLTGQDYPLKANADIETFFAEHLGSSFIEYFPLPHKAWPGEGGLHRIERWHTHHRILGRRGVAFPMNAREGGFRMIKRLVNLPFPAKREFLPGLRPYCGSAYWNLSREAVHQVSTYVDNNPDFVDFFRSTYCTDEVFFQTLLLNSYPTDKIINDDLRHIDWSHPGEKPAIFRTEDFSALCSSPDLFARKFDPSVDSHILDMIDKHLLLQ